MKDHTEVAKRIVEEILTDLKSRSGIGDMFDQIEDDLQEAIEKKLVSITRNILLDSE